MLLQSVCSLAAQVGLRGFLMIVVSGDTSHQKTRKAFWVWAEALILPLPVPQLVMSRPWSHLALGSFRFCRCCYSGIRDSFWSGLPGAVGLPPWAVGPLVGVGPVAPTLDDPPGRESAAAFGTYPYPRGWVPLARRVEGGFFLWLSRVCHSTEGCRPHVSLSHHALAASGAVRRGQVVTMLSLFS